MNARVISFSLSLAFLVGCTFAGDAAPSSGAPGFFMGLWHGCVCVSALVVGVFTSGGVEIFARDNSGWFYGFGFLIGGFFFSWNIGLILGLFSVMHLILVGVGVL